MRRPVVFIGPYEHHSNELPWRESIADVVTIHEDLRRRHRSRAAGGGAPERYADRPLKIGSFSAASNVTGILSDVRAVSRRLLHRMARVSFWDFAAAAPYVRHPNGTGGRIADEDPTSTTWTASSFRRTR